MDAQVASTLKAVAANQGGNAVDILKENGRRCAQCYGHIEGIRTLREAAGKCEKIADYVEFFNKTLPFKAETDGESIVIHFGKPHCTCPVASELGDSVLCNCTCGHEEAMWGEFFGRTVKAEIISSHLRGGADCIVRLSFPTE